jgi:chromosome segregation ATPase
MKRSLRVPLLLAAVALSPRLASADAAAEARLRDALRAATAQVRTLEDEAATLRAKEAALQKELEAARAQPKAPPVPKHSDREVADLRRQLAEQAEANRRLVEAAAKCQLASQERAEAGRTCEEERAKLAPQIASCTEKLERAEAKNERIFGVGKEIIDWLAHVGVGGAIAAREPFLGLKRVQLENAAQDFEDKLYGERLLPAGSSPVSTIPAAP